MGLFKVLDMTNRLKNVKSFTSSPWPIFVYFRTYKTGLNPQTYTFFSKKIDQEALKLWKDGDSKNVYELYMGTLPIS